MTGGGGETGLRSGAPNFVIPAQAGTHFPEAVRRCGGRVDRRRSISTVTGIWVPACAGMTGGGGAVFICRKLTTYTRNRGGIGFCRGFFVRERRLERDQCFGVGFVGALRYGVVLVVIVLVQRLMKTVVGEPAAVEDDLHQQAVVETRAVTDHLAPVVDLLPLSVDRALDRGVGRRRDADRPRRLPRIAERPCRGMLAELVRARRRHVGEAACRFDAAGRGEALDEDPLPGGGPAVVAVAKRGGGEGGRFVFHRRVYGK